MATTIKTIQDLMQASAEMLGMDSHEILDRASELAEQYDDIEYLGNFQGEQARWGTRDHHVYKLADGSLVGVQWYNGATENQESFYEGRVVELKVEMVPTYKPAT